MTTTGEPETLAELISDCAAIPEDLRPQRTGTPRPPAPGEWIVDEACHSRVTGLDEY